MVWSWSLVVRENFQEREPGFYKKNYQKKLMGSDSKTNKLFVVPIGNS